MAASQSISKGQVSDLVRRKKELRIYFKSVLLDHTSREERTINQKIFTFLEKKHLLKPHTVIACTWPLEGEIDLRPLCHTLYKHHITVALPQTPPSGKPLIFRKWTIRAKMEQGRFNTYHPKGEHVTPSIIVVPLLAFDDFGYRLGYGGGFYDRTLARLPNCITIGYATQKQNINQLPKETWDKPLSYVITERHIYAFGKYSHENTRKM